MRVLSALLILTIVTTGCLSNPDMNTNTMKTMETRGFGSYIEVTGLKGEFVQGELLAVTRDKVWVLDVAGRKQWINIRYIRAAELYKYVSDSGFGAWGVLGGLSTLSHGFWLILTFPLWLLTSGIAAAAESHHVHMEYPETKIEAFRKWARFPQGMPVQAAPIAPTPRDQAWQLTMQAQAAARANDCDKVRELDARVRELDAELHTTTFATDEAIRRCLGMPSLLFPPPSAEPTTPPHP